MGKQTNNYLLPYHFVDASFHDKNVNVIDWKDSEGRKISVQNIKYSIKTPQSQETKQKDSMMKKEFDICEQRPSLLLSEKKSD